jgi:hypothetical protein
MPKWDVTLQDGRTVPVYAPDEAGALKQANHAEHTRVVIATKRGHEITLYASPAFAAAKVKD